MDKSLFFELSNKVIAISQEHGISPTTLKTYAGVLAIATGALAMGSLSSTNELLNSSPFKPTIEQNINSNNDQSTIAFDDLRNFIAGDGDAMVYKNPFAKNELITLVHSDKYKTLADLDDPEKWAARVAAMESVNSNTNSYTFCKNGIDWEKPSISLSGKCLTILNIQQADSKFADVSSKSSLTIEDMRLFVLLHETAHGHSTTRSMSALHKSSQSELYRHGFAEKQADLAAFIAISKTLSTDNTNALFDAIIKSRSESSSYKPSAYDTHGLLVISKKLFNENPALFKDTPKEDILYKASLMAKVYNDTENKEVFFPNFQNNSIIPASIDGIVSRLQDRNNSESKFKLMDAIGIKHYQSTNMDKNQLTDLVMSNIDNVNLVVDASRTPQTFENLINNNVSTIAPFTDTTVFNKSLSKLMGANLDTKDGYNESLKKVVQPIYMEQ